MKDVMFCGDNDLITSAYLFKTSKSTVGEVIFYNGGPKGHKYFFIGKLEFFAYAKIMLL